MTYLYIYIHSTNHDLKFQLSPITSHNLRSAFTFYFNPHDHAQIGMTRSGLDRVKERHAHRTQHFLPCLYKFHVIYFKDLAHKY